MDRDTKRKLYLRKKHFFVMEKYIEDVKRDEKHVPDLLEAIMRSNPDQLHPPLAVSC